MTSDGPSGGGVLPDDVLPVRLPDAARIFEVRAARFRGLATGHPVEAYLTLLGAVADAQALACRELPVDLGAHRLLAAVPLQADAWPRSYAWRHAVDRIVRHLADVPAPAETTASLSRLSAMELDDLERLADAVLRGAAPTDAAASVFVAAALQTYWTLLAALVPPESVAHTPGGRCPVCGSPPVAGLVLGDQSLRYLTCCLCASSWRLTRLTCVHCGSTADLSYYVIDGGPPGAKAEGCGRCRRYVKLFYREALPAAEPLTDDVATVALDLLMADEGFTRAGRNPFLMASQPA
jgi:FdhE protein